jgi:hypothetical protein
VVVGLALVAAATIVLTRVSVTTQGTDLIIPLAMRGTGTGLMLMTLNTHLINAAPRRLVGRVTSLTNALQQVVTSLSIAGLATILTARATAHLSAARAASAARHARPAGAPSHNVVVRLAHELHAALSSAFVAAVAGALLGVALRRPRAMPTAAADNVAADSASPQGAPIVA